MKKTLSLILALVLCFGLCACGGTLSTQSSEPIDGKYVNISFSQDTTYTLNENTTYDKSNPNEKGTYKANNKGFVLTNANDNHETEFVKEGDYYYRSNLICCFEEDEEYGLKPTFTADGKSNQWFSAFYDTISENRWNAIILVLNDDGTFKLRDCIREYSSQSDGTVYEGTYSLDGNVLNLEHADGVIKFLYVNDKIYFDVIQKQG